jgi:hypothetical protein
LVFLYIAVSALIISDHCENKYSQFDIGGYDGIIQNYWMSPVAYDLPRIFQLALKKVTGHMPTLRSNDRIGTAMMLDSVMASATSTDAQKQIAVDTLQVVLYNLLPIGRNSLYYSKQVTALRQEVSNINPSANLYGDLGISTTSNQAEIKQAYKKKIASLQNSTSSADRAKAKQVSYAYEVLSNQNTKSLYDTAQIEPTVFNKIIGDTLYVHLKEMSPTTPQEFAWVVDSASSTPSINTMIIDLRGNIGGATDVARGMAGLFLGNNLDVFGLYHQGYQATSTIFFWKLNELDKYREIAVLTDNLTQSTAEVFTGLLQSFHLAFVVGSTTRGWGTIENTYPIQSAFDPSVGFTLYLVNSLTLKSNGHPIEGNGITPDIDISQKGWQDELPTFSTSASLIKAIESTIAQPPRD